MFFLISLYASRKFSTIVLELVSSETETEYDLLVSHQFAKMGIMHLRVVFPFVSRLCA